MKFFTKFLSLATAVLLCAPLAAQETPHTDGFLKRFSVGLDLGTYGGGFQAGVSLLPSLKARVGFDYLEATYSRTIDFDADDYYTGVNYDGQIFDPKASFPNAKLMLDYYPAKNVPVCLTGGVYFGTNKVDVRGYYPGRAFSPLENTVITPDSGGDFTAQAVLGNSVKPYFGIGVGRTIPKKRVGCRFDIGAVYQGQPVLEGPYVSTMPSSQYSEVDNVLNKWYVKWFPMLNFSVNVRLN